VTTSQFVLDHSTTDHPRFAITSADKDGVCVVSVHGDLDYAAVRCAVAADGPATARPLRAVGLSTEIAIYPTVACAMRAMREATSENPPTPVLTEAGSAR
jgi:hypothetical protein